MGVTYRVYANFCDGRGLVRANNTEYKVKARAENEAFRLRNGKLKLPRALVVVHRKDARQRRRKTTKNAIAATA